MEMNIMLSGRKQHFGSNMGHSPDRREHGLSLPVTVLIQVGDGLAGSA
jgi:hypothetical protein